MSVSIWSDPTIVNTTTATNQRDPRITTLTDGRLVVVWEDLSTNPDRIMQRVYNADGTPAGGEELVYQDAAFNTRHPSITALSNGGWVVAYDLSGGNNAKVYDSAGILQSTIAPALNSSSDHPDLITVGSGIWYIEQDDASDNVMTISIMTIDGSGAHSLSTTVSAPSDTTGTQTQPTGTQLDNGNVVVAWRDGNDIEFRIFDSAGVAQTVNGSTNDNVVTEVGSDAQGGIYGFPEILALENGGFLITWSDGDFSFDANDDLGASHFISSGRAEGRTEIFDSRFYLGNYADLRSAFGTDIDAAASHFIQAGFNEGRSADFNSLEYIASYADLIGALGSNATAGLNHFLSTGFNEGRGDLFDASAYLNAASNADLLAAFGSDTDAATQHYIDTGFNEGRAIA